MPTRPVAVVEGHGSLSGSSSKKKSKFSLFVRKLSFKTGPKKFKSLSTKKRDDLQERNVHAPFLKSGLLPRAENTASKLVSYAHWEGYHMSALASTSKNAAQKKTCHLKKHKK